MISDQTERPEDQGWMRQALAAAERGRGAVEPNPLVGAVLVRDGRLVGVGWHERYGQAHAEVNAFRAAGSAAAGATLYVTLEPCCHHGKTPPCTDAVLASGVRRVVAAMPDPFPAVAGNGFERLRRAGVAVTVGVEDAAARRLNAPYLKLLSTGLPYVHAKWAMTLDGRIATRTGDSKWISNEESRRRAHLFRGTMDVILVGIGTALSDDPLLTARPPGPRIAARVVLDSRGRLPITSRLVRTADEAPVIIVTTAGGRAALGEHERQGCEVLVLPGEHERPDLSALLREFGRRRMTNVLVEGGAEVLGGMLGGRLIDEVRVSVAPALIGGATAPGPIGGVGSARLSDVLRLAHWSVEDVAGDVFIHGRVEPAERGALQ